MVDAENSAGPSKPIAGVPTSAVAPTMAKSTARRSVARSGGAIASDWHTRETVEDVADEREGLAIVEGSTQSAFILEVFDGDECDSIGDVGAKERCLDRAGRFEEPEDARRFREPAQPSHDVDERDCGRPGFVDVVGLEERERVGVQQLERGHPVATSKRGCCFDGLGADMGAFGDRDVGRLVEQLVRAGSVTLRRSGVAEHRQRPAQQRGWPIGAVTGDKGRHDLFAFRQAAERQQRTTDAEVGDLGQQIVSQSALLRGGQRAPSQERFEVLVHERPGMVDERVVELAVAVEETLEAFVILSAPVATGRHAQAEHNQVVVIGRRYSEDPLGPVSDLILTAKMHLSGDGCNERAGKPAVAPHACPVDRSSEVWPQLVEPGDSLDLGRPGEQLVGSGNQFDAPSSMPLRDAIVLTTRGEVFGAELPHAFQ